MNGEKVLHSSYKPNISSSSLSDGIYIARIKLTNGKYLTQKISIKH